jgi:hypothetical protein
MNLSKKALIAAAVTGVLPSASQAAALNVNLVVNPSFESVSGTAATDWSGANVSTYAYTLNYTGPAPAGAGDRYWFGGGADPLAFQLIDLTGNVALIDAGMGNYSLSAFFSTYLLQLDFGTVRALFLDGADAQLGSASVGGAVFTAGLPVVGNASFPDARAWGQDAIGGILPVGTRTVRIELDGEKEPNVGSAADGYIDLVNFQIAPVPEPSTWSILGLSLFVGGWSILRKRR